METEQALVNALGGLSGDCTVLVIAHRSSLVKQCDLVARLESGQLVDVSSSVGLAGPSASKTV